MDRDNQQFEDLLPPNLPPGAESEIMGITFKILSAADISEGKVPAIAFDPNKEIRYLIHVDCGHYVPFDPTPGVNLKSLGRLTGVSYTGKYCCNFHLKTCAICGRTLCIQGNPDGFKIENKRGKIEYLCRYHYIIDSLLFGIFS
jgi:hypothetical protein